MSKITTVGIGLAKNVFSVHGIDEAGVVVLRKALTRSQLAAAVAHSMRDRDGSMFRGA